MRLLPHLLVSTIVLSIAGCLIPIWYDGYYSIPAGHDPRTVEATAKEIAAAVASRLHHQAKFRPEPDGWTSIWIDSYRGRTVQSDEPQVIIAFAEGRDVSWEIHIHSEATSEDETVRSLRNDIESILSREGFLKWGYSISHGSLAK